jgi:hypothetical protein
MLIQRVPKKLTSCISKGVSNFNGFAIELVVLVFWKKAQKLLSKGSAIGFDKFGNLANGGSNCAYMQKSARLGISVFA